MAPVVALPTLRLHPRCPPRWDLHGACFLRARSCGPSRTLSPLPPQLAALSSGGGGWRCPPLPSFIPHPWGGQRCVGGGEGACRLPFVARMWQARRKHGAGTRRGTRHSAGGGGGMPRGSRRRPFHPAFAPPVVPPLGLARRLVSTSTDVWSVPHPLAAACSPCRFVLGGGGAFRPPLPASPTLGGAGVCGGGRGAHVVFPSLHACRRHDASTTQARGEAIGCSGGGRRFLLWAFPAFSMV